MKTRIFNGCIYIDPSAPRSHARGVTGYRHEEMDRWLAQNPKVKVRHLVQSHTYEKPTPMFCGTIRIVTTVLYDEQ